VFASRFLPALLSAALLNACAGLPTERGRTLLAADVAARGLSLPDAQPDASDPSAAWLAAPLAAPLNLDRAIQIALIRNPELRAEMAKLGIEGAAVYEAGRLANPLLSASWLSRGDEPHAQLSLGIALNFTDLLLLRSRSRIAEAQFDSTRLALGGAALDLAARVEAAYRRVAKATQLAELQRTLAQNARNAATLAQRFFDAGNRTRRDLALEQAAAIEAELQADAAALDLQLARGELQRLLGLPADANWSLAETLALPPREDETLADLQQLARDARLDIAAARRRADAIAARHRLTRRTSALGGIEIGAQREREYDGSVHSGPTLALALPIFDWGTGRKARAAAELQAAEAELAAREQDAAREVAAAYARLREARTRSARIREELLPARETAVDETQRAYNYMLVDAFELLSARQQGYAAYAAYLESLGDYWVARAELARAVGRRLPQDDAQRSAALRFTQGRPQLGYDASEPAADSHSHSHDEPDATSAAHEHHDAHAGHAPPPSPGHGATPVDCTTHHMSTMDAAAHKRWMAACAPSAPAELQGEHHEH